MTGREETDQQVSRSVSTARRWGEYLIAVLGGNILYMLMEPQLPTAFRHRIFRIDLGLGVDFAICVAVYGFVRLARGRSNDGG